MPLVGLPPMPFVTINQNLIQQMEVPIGESVQNVGKSGAQIITELASRTYLISVFSTSATERDYYREAIIGIFKSLYASILQPSGLDVRHKWQAASGQVADDIKGTGPGFYYSDVTLSFDGTVNIKVAPIFGVIEHIDLTVFDEQENILIQADMPEAPYG
jgi:hypothetical protein